MDPSVNHEVPREIGLLFNSVAADYDAARPGYPAKLFDDLETIAGLGQGGRVLEIGPGTGIATRALLARGWRVRAVEPGADMADIVRRRSPGDALQVDRATFEDWQPTDTPFDVVVSATAFHWVHPDVRWAKTASILTTGGHLALMTNRTVAGNTFHELYGLSRDLHRRYASALEDEGPSPSSDELTLAVERAAGDIGSVWSAAEPKSGLTTAGRFYEPPTVRTQIWEQEYSAPEAVRLLSTYSPYLALAPDDRTALFAGIEELINERFGGAVVRRYLSILAVARRADQAGAT